MGARRDVAIYQPRAWPLYAEPPQAAPGGAEVQTVFLARALAAAGLRVCHIVGEDPSVPARAGDVDLIPMPKPELAIHKARHARRILRALQAADAAVYLQRSPGPYAGLLALFARARRRRYVLSTSWDGDLTTPLVPGRAGLASYRLGLRLADTIVVQTEKQLGIAKGVVNRPITVIRSIAETFPESEAPREAFLWIGRVVDYKDPLAYLDLAERLPDARFWMVADTSGNPDAALLAALRQRAAAAPNLELLPTRPRDQLGELYERAIAVVSTSTVEGFSNTFMEGWARGAPALALRLDPDRIIERYRLGACVEGSIDSLAAAARALWASGGDREAGVRARRYIATEHAPEVIAARWRDLIDRLGARH